MVSNLTFLRPQARVLLRRLREPRRFIQVIAGPRQVGKTTLALQVAERSRRPCHVASADEPTLRGPEWLETQWESARLLAGEAGRSGALLVLDEIQKVPRWPEVVKSSWDRDTRKGVPLKVVLLGSAPLLIQKGLTESLAGRFELLPLPHWSFSEMREAFGWDLDRYVFFGAYPGSAPLIAEPHRWSRYIRDSLIETTISRDVLLMTRIDKPALLRRLFELGCRYSGQILSYTKMLGQLQDAGNTTTLAHYLKLLTSAGMLTGLQKYSGSTTRTRSSSPKLQVMNTALMTSQIGLTPAEARADHDLWGRLVETVIGTHLVNAQVVGTGDVYYWRDRNREVDFVFRSGRRLLALEVKSRLSGGPRRTSLKGMHAFIERFRPTRKLLVGGDGIPIDRFLARPVEHWLR